MEKIDLNNYEAYFLDYMEGSLSAEEKYDLFAFLEKHPDLKEELELDVMDMELMPTSVTFDAKESLKVDADKLMITTGSVDELMIAAVEGQLSKSQKQQLETYVKDNNLTKSYAYTKATQLKPDLSIQFEDKASLKQKTGLIISMTWVTRVASIAAVGAILIMIGLNWNSTEDEVANESFTAEDVKSHNRLNANERNWNTSDFANEDQFLAEEGEQNFPAPQNENRPREIQNELPNMIAEDIKPERIANEKEEKEEDLIAPPILPLENLDDEIAEDPSNQVNEHEENATSITEDLADANTVEQPYRLITNAASDLINREVSFTREKDNATENYVAYGFKLGKFEFERKKSK